MPKVIGLILLMPYILSAFFWEGVRMLWWMWNKTYLVWPRRHSRLEVYLMMWLCQWPGLTEAIDRLEEISE